MSAKVPPMTAQRRVRKLKKFSRSSVIVTSMGDRSYTKFRAAEKGERSKRRETSLEAAGTLCSMFRCVMQQDKILLAVATPFFAAKQKRKRETSKESRPYRH